MDIKVLKFSSIHFHWPLLQQEAFSHCQSQYINSGCWRQLVSHRIMCPHFLFQPVHDSVVENAKGSWQQWPFPLIIDFLFMYFGFFSGIVLSGIFTGWSDLDSSTTRCWLARKPQGKWLPLCLQSQRPLGCQSITGNTGSSEGSGAFIC